MREGLVNAETFVGTSGITPACAGRTRKIIEEKSYWRDHPRVCGKNANYFGKYNKQRGSPPHVREGRCYSC